MLKVKGPDGKPTRAGSHNFPVGTNSCCHKRAYVYLDMLRLLTMVCEHQKASLAQMRAWHSEVKTYMGFIFAED